MGAGAMDTHTLIVSARSMQRVQSALCLCDLSSDNGKVSIFALNNIIKLVVPVVWLGAPLPFDSSNCIGPQLAHPLAALAHGSKSHA